MVRMIQPEDAETVRNICEKSLGHVSSAGCILQRINELSGDAHYYIAVYEDEKTHQVSGFIQAEKYDLLYGDCGWNIIALAVSQEEKGQGIGRQLLASLEEKAHGEENAFVRLNCNVVRESAHKFYEHMGYVCDKTQKRYIKKL